MDYYFYKKNLKILKINKDDFEIFSKNIALKDFKLLEKKIRDTLIPHNETLKPFATKASYELNKNTFIFFEKKLNKFQDIIIIPDGPLNSIPLHALPIKEYKCIDCES